MADSIPNVVATTPSLGYVAPLTKDRSKHNKGQFSKETPRKEKNTLIVTTASAPRKDPGKGNVLDIRV